MLADYMYKCACVYVCVHECIVHMYVCMFAHLIVAIEHLIMGPKAS